MRLFTTSKDIGWSRWLDVNRLVKAHKESEHNFEVNNQPTRSGLNKKQLRARYISKQQLIDISHLITEEYYYNVLVGRCTVNLMEKFDSKRIISEYYIGFQKDEFEMSKYKKNVPLRYTYFCPNPFHHDIFIQ